MRPRQYFVSIEDTFDICLKPFEVKIMQFDPCADIFVNSPGLVKDEEISAPINAPFIETLREDIAWGDPDKHWTIRCMVNRRSQYVDS